MQGDLPPEKQTANSGLFKNRGCMATEHVEEERVVGSLNSLINVSIRARDAGGLATQDSKQPVQGSETVFVCRVWQVTMLKESALWAPFRWPHHSQHQDFTQGYQKQWL